MGQKHGSSGQPNMLDNWKAHAQEKNIFTNIITSEQVERHLVQLSKAQQQTCKKRLQEHHAAIVRVVHYHPVSPNSEDRQFYVYTDRIEPLNRQHWLPINSALFVLKGFRRLSSMYSLMRVTPKMISMNEKGEIKLWINQNPVLSEISTRAENEEQMLADIIRVIMNYDSSTAGLLVGCQKINEAINNILVSLTDQRGQVQFSQRNKEEKVTRPIEKMFYQKEEKTGYFNQSDRYKTRKTEEDWKNSSDPRKKVPPNTDTHLLHNVRVVGVPRYLNMENVQQDPQLQEKSNNASKKHSPYQRFPSEASVPNQYQSTNPPFRGYKQSTIQFNNTGPGKNVNFPPPRSSNQANEPGWDNDDRFLKVNHGQRSLRVDYANSPTPATTPQSYFSSSGGGPSSNSNRLDPDKKSPWKLFKKSDFQLQRERKSDLHQQFLHRQNDYGRITDFPPFIQKRKKTTNKHQSKKPEIIEESKKQENQGFEKWNRYYKNGVKHIDINGDNLRTRTQDFTNTVINVKNQQSWNSQHSNSRNNPYTSKYESNHPRRREDGRNANRKQLKSSELEEREVQKMKEGKSADNFPSSYKYRPPANPKVYGTESDKIKQYGTQSDQINQKSKKLEKKLSEPTPVLEALKKQKSLNEESSQEKYIIEDSVPSENFQQKKVVKKQLAKQLKMEFTSLLSPTEVQEFQSSKADEKSLLNTKSSKDLLIKQKVEKKKATFAELKSEAMKILKDDLL